MSDSRPPPSPPAVPGISVVVPVYNDREGMRELLDALAEQRRPPDEIVIVDGASTDGTLELLEARRGDPLDYRVVSAPGASIAHARNFGIARARHEWIACTDAGCRPVPGWLEAIDRARPDADFIAGLLIVEGETPLERVFALTHFPRGDELEPASAITRLSHRLFGRGHSMDRVGGGYMAFRKDVWLDVGGFPPGLRASDDRGFSGAVLRAGYRMLRVPEAGVRWRPRSSWRADARMFFGYARGDVHIVRPTRHAVRALAWAAAITLLLIGDLPERLVVIAAGLAYLSLPLRRAWQARLPVWHWWRIPLAVVVKDLAQLAGAARGLADVRHAEQRPAARPSRAPAAAAPTDAEDADPPLREHSPTRPAHARPAR